MTAESLTARANQAQALIDNTMSVLPSFEIAGSDRAYVSLSLLLASMDNAATLVYLLATRPNRAWVGALSLHRSQFDYFLRGSFFARVASDKELKQFQRKGRMPARAQKSGRKRDMYVSEVAEDVCEAFGWDTKLVNTLKGHWSPLSGIVHGGREVLSIYTMNDELGGLEIDFDELLPVLDNVIVLVQLAMAVAMSMSPLPEEQLSDTVEPVYNDARNFFAGNA